MQINGSNSNSLFFQPNAGKQTNRNANAVIDVKPVIVEPTQSNYRQYESVAKAQSDNEQARYIRTFASQAITASTTYLSSNSVQPSAIVEYQKVDSISLNVSGRIIDEVV